MFGKCAKTALCGLKFQFLKGRKYRVQTREKWFRRGPSFGSSLKIRIQSYSSRVLFKGGNNNPLQVNTCFVAVNLSTLLALVHFENTLRRGEKIPYLHKLSQRVGIPKRANLLSRGNFPRAVCQPTCIYFISRHLAK